MPSLRELQRGFSAAMLFGDGAAIAGLRIVAGKLDPQTRIAIYRDNILGNYRRVLAATYPVVRRLVGESFFDAATDQFVRGYPSRHGDVNRYGGDYALFLASYPPARELNYLADVARLEWAIDQANIAADAPPLDVTALAAIAPDLLGELRFDLHPAARLVASPFPILHIWQVNQPRRMKATIASILAKAPIACSSCAVAMASPWSRLGKGEHTLLNALAANATLGVAASTSRRAEPEFDLAAALRRHVASHTVVAFRAPRHLLSRGPVDECHRHRTPASAALASLYCKSAGLIDKLQPLLLLGFRLYVARVFFLSGLTKIHDWSITLALFTDEYHVPVLPPAVAAVMGTATELSMPVLLALGLATRFGAFVLFFFNIIAVISYAALPDIAIKDHILWGTMILVILLCGRARFRSITCSSRRLGLGSK